MKKLCPNLDREDGLETVLEVPIPEEILTHKSGTTKAWHNMKNWMKPHAESRSNSASMAAVFGGKNTEIQLLLGVVGAPLIPSPIASDNQPITRSIKDQHIEVSMAKYIVKQYVAAVGGERALNSVDSMYAMGQVKMATSEFSAGEGSVNSKKVKNLQMKGEVGGFVVWQKRPELWCLELVVSGYKISAGSDGKVAWRQTPWHHSHASRGPPRPLRRFLQGLDPRSTANLFSNSICIGEKTVNNEDCFILKLEAESSTLRARSNSNVEIVRHTVWGYFSQRTGLLVQLEDSHLLKLKSHESESIYWETNMESLIQDYRTVDGIQVAHAGKTWVSLFRFGGGPETHSRTRMEEVWQVEEVDFNVKGLSIDCFLPPSDLKREGTQEPPHRLHKTSHHSPNKMALLLIIPISLVTLWLGYTLYQRLRFKLPPGPRPWPVVGNLYDIKPVRFRCFAEWAQSYGPIISVWFGSTLNVIVSNSELAKEVLKEHDQLLADRHRSRSAAKFSRDGKDLIWADYGPHYVKVRKVCTLELFSPKRLEALRPIREDEVTSMVDSVYNHCTSTENLGKGILLRKHLGVVAFNNITRLAFGKRFVNSEGVMDEQGVEFKAIVENGLKLGASLAMAEHIPWLRWMFPLEEGAFAKHGARRDRLTRAIMAEHTEARKKSGGAKQHFVDALLTLQDKYDLSEDTIIGLLWDMITAGMDTTAISVEWAMAELIRNPRVQQKVQEELDRVIGLERVMTEADFSNLPYLQCVTKEAMRLHPPTPLMLPHRANANVKVGGYDIPKGSNVHVNVWAVARDPAVWKDPLEFRPERFLEEDVDMKGHDFRLLPFGSGRRVCPGAQLGINLAASMLGHLLHHFCWTPPEGMKPEEIDMGENPGLVTYMRTPIQAVVSPRLPSHLYKRVPAEI